MSVFPWISTVSASNLAVSLLNSLWQGILIALLLSVVLRFIPVKWANIRYRISLYALFAVPFLCMTTWSLLNSPPNHPVLYFIGDSLSFSQSINPVESNPTLNNAPSLNLSTATTFHLLWTAWILLAWLCGVTFMLFRFVQNVWMVNRICFQCRPLEDRRVLDVVENFAKSLNIARPIQVWINDSLQSPAAIGMFQPAILIPSSVMSGLPMETVRAMIAHEMVHVCRFDYFVNLLQMVFESLFFFNPAVWWIGRQVRVEREARADAGAVLLTGNPREYLNALSIAAQQIYAENDLQVAPAFGRNHPSSSLLERIRRIVYPEKSTQLYAPMFVVIAVLVAALLILSVMKEGADYVAKKTVVITQSQIERMEELRNEYGIRVDGDYGEEDRIDVSGTVPTEDGSPLPKNVFIKAEAVNPDNVKPTTVALDVDGNGKFLGQIDYMSSFHIIAEASGFAPFLSNDLFPKPGEALPRVDCLLKIGFAGKVRFLDPQKNPIPNVKVDSCSVYKLIHNKGVLTRKVGDNHHLTSDENGVIEIPLCSDLKQYVDYVAPGFQHDNAVISLKSDDTRQLTLQPSKLSEGIVVSSVDQTPVANAELRLVEYYMPFMKIPSKSSERSKFSIYTDDRGHFRIPYLRDNGAYAYAVIAPGYAWGVLDNVRAGLNDLRVELHPPKTVKGEVRGNLNHLGSERCIYYYPIYQLGGHDLYLKKNTVKIEERDGVGRFEITECNWSGRLRLRFGNSDKTISTLSHEKIVLNLHSDPSIQNATRTVIFQFRRRKDLHPLKGAIPVSFESVIEKPNRLTSHSKQRAMVPIINDEARIDIPVPGRIDYNPSCAIGYWFNTTNTHRVIKKDANPYVISLLAVPAGTIYGIVKNEDGSIPQEVSMRVEISDKYPNQFAFSSQRDIHTIQVNDGNFNFHPLPLANEYRILAQVENKFALSESILLKSNEPIREVNLLFKELQSVSGRVTDIDGNPLAGIRAYADTGFIDGIYPILRGKWVLTDSNGDFKLDNINPDCIDEYEVYVTPQKDYQPFVGKITDLQKTVQLKKGWTAHGVVLDASTGLPIKGMQLSAVPEDRSRRNLRTESPTNEKGEFRFSTLPEGRYTLRPDQGETENLQPLQFDAGHMQPIILKVNIPLENPFLLEMKSRMQQMSQKAK